MPEPTIHVEGLNELRAALRKAGDKATGKALGQAGKSAADIVAQAARPKVPVRTGRAKASLRAVVASGGGTVAFGGAKAPYASWLDFGGRVGRKNSVVRPFKREGRYVYVALSEKRDEVVRTYAERVDDVLRDAGLR